jgi:glutamate-1-semialdehyde 2,1-aminomutase
MGAMQVFLERLETPAVRALYTDLDERWNGRAARLNVRLREAGLPVQVANMSSIWTVYYTQPARYNWMLQYYLRAEGLALSWVGTGRLIFSLNYSVADFDAVCDRFVAAAQAMHRDGWWWEGAMLTNHSIRRGILREIVRQRLQVFWNPPSASAQRPARAQPDQALCLRSIGSINSPRNK